MKRSIFSCVLLLTTAILQVSCGAGGASTTTAMSTTASAPETTTAPTCTHVWELDGKALPTAIKDGSESYVCALCKERRTESIPATKSIKILAIGNSFSVDAMESHLYDVLKGFGVEDIVLGNLYIPGCSLDTHWNNMVSGEKAYEYQCNRSGKWTKRTQSIKYALEAEDWDVITVQQVSGDSGKPSTLGNLQNILDYINEHKTNENAKIYWHMTWAYQQNSTHSSFANYQKSQDKMYAAITKTASSIADDYADIDGVIPSGTAIQNLRTSYIGDNLTRDGYHLSYYLGRYTASLTWASYILGADTSDIDKFASADQTVGTAMAAVKEAVECALAKPFEVSESSYPPGDPLPVPSQSDLEDSSKYTKLELEFTLGAYYNSPVSGSVLQSAENSSAGNLPYYAATRIFTKEELPVGTVITVDEGYQYRPEAWTSLTSKTSNRPETVSTALIVVDEIWWSGFSYRAFNLSHIGATTRVTQEDTTHLCIYVPVS